MDKLSENKHAFLLGDFTIDLMKNDIAELALTFLDTLTSICFLPHIHPTRITPHSKTLIDNIFVMESN